MLQVGKELTNICPMSSVVLVRPEEVATGVELRGST